MPYQFATDARDYADFASGRVLVGAPGHPALPVRLSSELFQRCLSWREKQGLTGRVCVYDPCCGSAYHLTTMAFLHWSAIDRVITSDVDATILDVAARNLRLLTRNGLQARAAEIAQMQADFGKVSHADSAESAARLAQQLERHLDQHAIVTDLFQADATQSSAVAAGLASVSAPQIDVVVADVPYGWRSQWVSAEGDPASMLWQLLDALLPSLTPNTIVAISADKRQRCKHEGYQRADRFQIGKRRITLLHPLS